MTLVTLSNGRTMPTVQLGTFRMRGARDISIAVTTALEAGYRAIDTAAVYRNHAEITATLADQMPRLGLTRADLFLTSKLSPREQGRQACRGAVERALVELDTNYLDLFLIHWPGVQGLDVKHADNQKMRLESWLALEELYKEGVLRSIGVSNFSVAHLEHLLQHCSIVPHVNQIEIHPHYPQQQLVKFCVEHNIHPQAYSSLGQNGPKSKLLSSQTVLDIALATGKSPAQVLLKWGLQHGFSVLPKSINPVHIRDNFNLQFSLASEHMDALDNLHLTDQCTKYAWNPDSVL